MPPFTSVLTQPSARPKPVTSLQLSLSSRLHSHSPTVGNSANAGPNKPSPNRLSEEAGPPTGVSTALLAVHGYLRRRPRLRCTIASTPHTFMIPPRALLRCVRPPSSLPPSLTDLLTLCLVAFRPVAAVSAPGHIRPEGNGVGWFRGCKVTLQVLRKVVVCSSFTLVVTQCYGCTFYV